MRLQRMRTLIENDVTFGSDRFGRWLSVVVAECEASEEVCDLVIEADAAWLERNGLAG